MLVISAVCLLSAISCKQAGKQAYSFPSTEEVREQLWEEEFESLKEQTRGHWQYGMEKDYSVNPNMLDSNVVVWKSDCGPADVLFRRTKSLLKEIREMGDSPALQKMEERLNQLEAQLDILSDDKYAAEVEKERQLYYQLKALNREVALSNPLLDFDSILFVSRKEGHPGIIQGNDVYNPPAGGGLYVVSGLKSSKPVFKNILEGTVVTSGQNQGNTLHDNPYRVFQGPELSFDGKEVLFSYADKSVKVEFPFTYNAYPTPFHIYSVGVDGSRLSQITDGKWKDYSPCWLPDGRIVFVSERCELSNRCSGEGDYEPVGILYSMKRDGSDLYPISYGEVNELHPSIDNQGRLVFTRWDYIDRDFSAAHHIWTSYPDGRDPRGPHGNYPYPHSTLDMKHNAHDGRADRPWAEQYIRAIPGEANRYVAIATGHHTHAAGPIIVIDLSIPDDHRMSQVKIVTGNGRMPVDGTDLSREKFMYVSPWPIGGDFFIAAEYQTRNVFLIDKFGNRTLLFSAPVDLFVYDPVPVKARFTPPAILPETFQGEREGLPSHKKAVISVQNIYESDFEWPENTKITALRVIQVFPRPMRYPDQMHPVIGYGDGANARMVLGTVPVEEDGSAYFEAPVGKSMYFQALDSLGMAVQSMRSSTYVHPGEHLSCIGCHEDKWKSVTTDRVPKALQREPSKLTPEPEGAMPFSYARLAKPVLEKKCVSCHVGQGRSFTNADYRTLEPYAFYFHGSGSDRGLDPVHGGYRTVAGRFGARESRMGKALLSEPHVRYKRAGYFTDEDLYRVTLWLDCNSNEFGAYNDADKQSEGKVVWPIGVDPENPTGVERR